MDLKDKILGSETLYDGKIIKLEISSVEQPNGRKAKREIIRHPGGVGIVALDGDGSIYLVRQYRVPYDDILLEIPAGKLDLGEAPVDAAKRELSEETGLAAQSMQYIGDFYPSVGYTDEILRMFIAENLTQGDTHPDEGEFLNIVKMPFDEAVNLVMSGDIKDGKTIAAILKAKLILGERA